MTSSRSSILPGLAALGTCLALVCPGLAAASYPAHPIKVVVAAPPGGVPDTVARVVGQQMSSTLGQPVVVENRPGVGGLIAVDHAAKAAPDGYTVLITDSSPLTINPTLYRQLPYDGIDSFEAVAFLGAAQLFLAVGPSVTAGNLEELLAQARANPGKLTYGTVGVGSLHHIMFEELSRGAGIEMLHVPFREQPSGPVAAGQVDMLLAGLPSIQGLVSTGKLRILGVTSQQRTAQLPEVPTLAEGGVPGYAFTADIGLFTPKGTPAAVNERLARAAREAIDSPEVKTRLEGLGILPDGRLLVEYDQYMRAETDKFSEIVNHAGLAGIH